MQHMLNRLHMINESFVDRLDYSTFLRLLTVIEQVHALQKDMFTEIFNSTRSRMDEVYPPDSKDPKFIIMKFKLLLAKDFVRYVEKN